MNVTRVKKDAFFEIQKSARTTFELVKEAKMPKMAKHASMQSFGVRKSGEITQRAAVGALEQTASFDEDEQEHYVPESSFPEDVQLTQQPESTADQKLTFSKNNLLIDPEKVNQESTTAKAT